MNYKNHTTYYKVISALVRCVILSPIIYQVTSFLLKFPSYNSIGGIAYKDASNWELCAKSLSIYGVFPVNTSDWCLRRPINIEVLSSFYSIFGSFSYIYFLLALFFSISLFWANKYFEQLFNETQSLFLTSMSVFLWIALANNMVLSESISLIIGTLSIGFFLRFEKDNKVFDLFAMLVALVMIELIRPGNILISFSVIFLILGYSVTKKAAYALLSIATFIPLIFTFILKLVANSFGYGSYLTAGNTWATIYGLINGNSTWQEAYAIVPAKFTYSELATNNYLKNESLREFINEPYRILISILFNFYDMLARNFPFFLPINVPIPSYFQLPIFFVCILLLLYFVFRLYKSTKHMYSKNFGLFTTLTTLFFYAATWKSEAARALAPTLLFTVVIGFYLVSQNVSSNEIYTIRNLPKHTKINMKFRKIITPILLPILILVSIMYLNHFSPGKQKLPEVSLHCPINSFQFDARSTIMISTLDIKSASFLGWSSLIEKLPSGFIIQGLANVDSKVYSFTTFLPGNTDLSYNKMKNTCYKINNDSEQKITLEELNFQAISIATS